jgi:hypothetical protein
MTASLCGIAIVICRLFTPVIKIETVTIVGFIWTGVLFFSYPR